MSKDTEIVEFTVRVKADKYVISTIEEQIESLSTVHSDVTVTDCTMIDE